MKRSYRATLHKECQLLLLHRLASRLLLPRLPCRVAENGTLQEKSERECKEQKVCPRSLSTIKRAGRLFAGITSSGTALEASIANSDTRSPQARKRSSSHRESLKTRLTNIRPQSCSEARCYQCAKRKRAVAYYSSSSTSVMRHSIRSSLMRCCRAFSKL